METVVIKWDSGLNYVPFQLLGVEVQAGNYRFDFDWADFPLIFPEGHEFVIRMEEGTLKVIRRQVGGPW